MLKQTENKVVQSFLELLNKSKTCWFKKDHLYNFYILAISS